MVDSFKKGYDYFVNNMSSYAGSVLGADYGDIRSEYINKIKEEIEKFEKNINSFEGIKTSTKILKGDVAEFWHAGTFNINAAINKSNNRMNVDRSHEFGSVDVVGMDETKYSMKYYGTGNESAKAQATSVFERFREYKSKGGEDTLEKYLSDRNYNDVESVLNDPVYMGQIRIIPSDQLQDAVTWLERKIEIERIKRPEQVFRYEETLKLLNSKIIDSNGNESIELTEEDAVKLALLAKKGDFKAEDFGLTIPDILNFQEILKESTKAGLNAAMISMILKVGPEIYNTIEYLIKTGEIEEYQFKKIGFLALTSSSEGFIRGSVAAALTACCNSGVFGEKLKNIDPSIISVITVMTMNIVKEAYNVSIGKSSRGQMANIIVNDILVSTFSLIGGNITQSIIKIPVLGYMVGSFVGSIVGEFIYNGISKATLTFCVDSGFTLFGLVEQDYKLPDDIIKYIGINVFNYDTFKFETFEPNTFNFETFKPDTFEVNNIGITFLRKGVIGINKIGYLQ